MFSEVLVGVGVIRAILQNVSDVVRTRKVAEILPFYRGSISESVVYKGIRGAVGLFYKKEPERVGLLEKINYLYIRIAANKTSRNQRFQCTRLGD